MADRDRLLFDLCMALRQAPPGMLRDLGKPGFRPTNSPRRSWPKRS